MSLNYRYHRNHCGNKCCNEPQVLEDVCDNIEDMYCCPKYDIDECSCGFNEVEEYNGLPANPILAQAYVPIQRIDKTFVPSVGLKMGTIFPELVRPYMPGQSMMIKNIIEAKNVIGEGCNCGM